MALLNLTAPYVQFVADGVFYAELNELLTRELAEHGYSGVEVRVTPMRTEIIIRATRTQNVLGETLRCLGSLKGNKAQRLQVPWTAPDYVCFVKSCLSRSRAPPPEPPPGLA